MYPTAAPLYQHVTHMTVTPATRERLTKLCHRASQTSALLPTIFNVIHEQGQHGREDVRGFRELLAHLIARALIVGHALSTVYQTYLNACVHNNVMGYTFNIGPHLLTEEAGHIRLHSDVLKYT